MRGYVPAPTLGSYTSPALRQFAEKMGISPGDGAPDRGVTSYLGDRQVCSIRILHCQPPFVSKAADDPRRLKTSGLVLDHDVCAWSAFAHDPRSAICRFAIGKR